MIRRIEMDVQIDDDLLAEHVEESGRRGGPYSADPGEWDASDVFRMAERGILDPDESTFTDRGAVAE